MIELTLSKNLLPFDHTRVANSNEYNLMIEALTNDINALLSATAVTNQNADDFLVLDTENIELINGQLNQLLKKYQSYINLHQKDNFTSVIALDFSSQNDRLLKTNSYLSDRLYSDPKVPSLKLGDDNLLYINPNKEALQLPIDQETNVTIRDIELIHSSDFGSYQNFFYTKDNYEPISLEIKFDLESIDNISFLKFNSDALYPFNITGASYLNDENSWVEIPNTSILNAFGNIEINFGIISTSSIKIGIDLISCKATNQTINYSYDQFTQYLLENSNLYYTLDDFVPNNGNDYAAFIFHFALSNTFIGLRTRKKYGIFVSRSATVKEPAQFYLESEHLNDQGDISVEYAIYKTDFDTEGSPIGEGDMIPILRGSDPTVVNEVLRPIDYVAKLNFYPQGAIVIKRNGIVLDPQYYTYDETINSIIFLINKQMSISSGPVYTIDYTPVFNGSQFPTPLNDPNSAITKTSIHPTSEGNVIGTTITFTLPYNYEDGTIQIDRFINGEIDSSAPDPNASMTVEGRIITFDHDTDAYPKLTGSDFHFTGDTFGAQLDTTELYYYNSDNSLIINWDAFSLIENYSHSEVRLVIMFRRVKEIYTEEEFMADNIFLYSNNFNDLLTSVSNYSGI